MSKKDYQVIAGAIFRTRARHAAFTHKYAGVKFCAADSLAEEMADMLAQDSPCFNRALFLEACETGSCKGMKAVSK